MVSSWRGCLWAYFNPRTREGCDITHSIDVAALNGDFNPRTREGCDNKCAGNSQHLLPYFNPRTREGCDKYSCVYS